MLMVMPKVFYLRNADDDTQGVILEAFEVGTESYQFDLDVNLAACLRGEKCANAILASMEVDLSMSIRTSLGISFSHEIFIFPREFSLFSLGKTEIPWKNGVPKLVLRGLATPYLMWDRLRHIYDIHHS
jgi:hypothetical protein